MKNFLIYLFIGAQYFNIKFSDLCRKAALPFSTCLIYIGYLFVPKAKIKIKTDIKSLYHYVDSYSVNMLKNDVGGFIKNDTLSSLLFLLWMTFLDIVLLLKCILKDTFIDKYITIDTAMPIAIITLILSYFLFILIGKMVEDDMRFSKRVRIKKAKEAFLLFSMSAIAICFIFIYLIFV